MANRRGAAPGCAAALFALGCASAPPPAPRPAPAAAPALAKAAPASGAVSEGPPITLLPASTARPLELVAISVTSADRLLTNGATLAGRAVPLPIDPSGLRDMLLGQAGLAPEVSANLDLGSPSSAAIVSTGRGADTGVVIAVAARGPAEAERVIGALGKAVMKRGAVVLVDNGSGGRGWVFRAGNVVVLSDKLEALARGAMLALEARHAAPEDVTAVLYPDAIARANGTDVKTALAFVIEAVRTAQAAQAEAKAKADEEHPADEENAGGKKKGGRKPPARTAASYEDHSLEMAAEILGMVADVETAELGLSVDPTTGLVFRARLRPRASSALAGVAREAHPYELDRAIVEGAGVAPAVVAASSYGPFIRGTMARQRERLAAVAAADPKDRSLAAALAFTDAMTAALAGQTSAGCTFSVDAPHFSSDITYPLKDAATAAKLSATLAALDRAAVTALWDAQVGRTNTFDWAVKKETVGKLKALHYTLTLHDTGKNAPPAAREAAQTMSKLFGRGLDAYVAVVGTRFVATVGHNAKARLAVLGGAKPPGAPPAPAPGPLADALSATAGRDGFLYLDLGSVLSLVGSYAQDPRAALLARGAPLPIPVFGSMGGDGAGKVWTLELTLPPAAFVGAGAIIQRLSTSVLPSQSRR
jgi:hypothetical protein